MALRLYDTLTRQKISFEPADPRRVRMYVCGPTVYDFAHIGNARPVIVFDVLFRLLHRLYGVDHVLYARNITDVDDKINARAAERGISIRDLTDGTLRQFHADVDALGCLRPTSEPRATDHIEGMKALIERLLTRGVAYVAEDHVLFSVGAMERLPKVPRYGSLARRSLDEMLAGARVDVAPYKRDPMDFVLWKPSEGDQPRWPSPGGILVPGRPGWHIECSAMSMAELLEPFGGGLDCDDPEANVFDIHGGGIDLVFPHHENEVAQTCCALGTPRMARVWMHNGFLQVEGQKMSKSLGNFVTIRELLNQAPGAAIRLAMMGTHYRQPLNWTERGLRSANEELRDWLGLLYGTPVWSDWHAERQLVRPSEAFIEALEDDLNTPAALAELRRLFRDRDDRKSFGALIGGLAFLGIVDRKTWGALSGHVSGDVPPLLLSTAYPLVEQLKVAFLNADTGRRVSLLAELRKMGLEAEFDNEGSVTLSVKTGTAGEDEILHLIGERNKARERRDFAEADRIRDLLARRGIALKDSKEGTIWELAR